MEVLINSKSLCNLSVSSMAKLYNLLGKHAVTFHVQENNQKINIISPVTKNQIYLEIRTPDERNQREENNDIPLSFLNHLSEKLKQIGFEVIVIHNEEEKKYWLNKKDGNNRSLWLSLIHPEQEKDNGITAYFSFNQIKASKQLANYLIQNIIKQTDLVIHGVLFDWKNIMNHLFPLSVVKQTMPAVVLSCKELHLLSNQQLEQLTGAIFKALLMYYDQQELVEIVQFCLAEQEDTKQENTKQEKIKEEEKNHLSNEPTIQFDPKPRQTATPNHSTFSLLYHQSVESQAKKQPPKTISSYVAYMHKLSEFKNQNSEKEEKPKPVDFLTLQERK